MGFKNIQLEKGEYHISIQISPLNIFFSKQYFSLGFFLFNTSMQWLPPIISHFCQKVFLIVVWKLTTAPKPLKKNTKETKNQIHRDVALGELIIFAIHGNFPKRLFRAVDALEVDENMQKMTLFLFKWVWEMR